MEYRSQGVLVMKNKLTKYFPYLMTILCILYFWWSKEYSNFNFNLEDIEAGRVNVDKSWIDNYPIIKFMLPYLVGAMLFYTISSLYKEIKNKK